MRTVGSLQAEGVLARRQLEFSLGLSLAEVEVLVILGNDLACRDAGGVHHP